MEVLLVRLGVMFGAAVGWWWAAHHMAWWTFAIAATGCALLNAVLKVAIEDSKSTSNRAVRR